MTPSGPGPVGGYDEAKRALERMESGSPRRRIKLVIADDHAVLRQALRLLLEMQDEVEVVGDVGNGREAVEAAERLKPDVVLMDMVMPGLNGLDATRQIRRRAPDTRVVMLTGYVDDDQILEALRAGASGYLAKRSDVRELLLAIQVVHRGNPYLSESLSEGRTVSDLLLQAHQSTAEEGDPLTEREREVLQLVAEGHSNQRIAEQLFLSVKTVEAHRAHIMAKLHAQSRTDLIRYAIRKGMIALEPGDP